MPVLPRGGGTSQCGQTVGRALVVDTSKYLNRVVSIDASAPNRLGRARRRHSMRCRSELKPHGLTFPVDISTGSRATLGGMAGNNSCGARSIRYGNMVHNMRAIDIVLADGTAAQFGEVPDDLGDDVGRSATAR